MPSRMDTEGMRPLVVSLPVKTSELFLKVEKGERLTDDELDELGKALREATLEALREHDILGVILCTIMEFGLLKSYPGYAAIHEKWVNMKPWIKVAEDVQ